MNGVTVPVIGSTVTMRELLLFPVVRSDWFEVGREQAAAVDSILERDVDSGARRLKADPRRCWLAKRAFELVSILIEYEDVGREGILRAGDPPHHGTVFIIASARQSVAQFEHVDFERCTCLPKGKSRREIQPGFENRYLEARRHNDVLAAAGIKLGGIVGTILGLKASPLGRRPASSRRETLAT